MYDHHAFILGYRSVDVNLQKCHPLPSHATFLWSVYLENVDPLLKIIHVPTMEAILREARRNPEKLAPGQETLVFAVYFAAIVSLEDGEVSSTNPLVASMHPAVYPTETDHLPRSKLISALAKTNCLHSFALLWSSRLPRPIS